MANSKHHPVPFSEGGRETEDVCKECHKQIHAILTNKQLAKKYFTIKELQSYPEMQKWLEWRKKHPNVTVGHKMSKDRKRYSKYA